MTEIIIAVAIIAAALLAGLIIFILLYFGIIDSYHPVKKAKDKQIRVACVGDSITYGLMVRNRNKNNYPAVLNGLLGEDYCVNNFAYTNRTAIKSGDYPLVKEKIYQKSLDFKPNVVIILLGTNDSKKNNWDIDKFINDYCEIVDSYLSLETAPKVYALIPPPVFEVRGKVLYQIRKTVIEEEIIPAVKRIAELKGIDCINAYEVFSEKKELFADGVHPNVAGSRLLAETVYGSLINKDNIKERL